MRAKKRQGRVVRKAFTTALPHDLTPQLIDKINSLPGSVKTDYLKAEVLSKFVSKETANSDTRRTRAIFKWLCTEMQNEATNERLLITPSAYNILPRVSFSSFVEKCRDLIRGIIGDTPPIEALIGSFSGGASTSRPRTCSYPASKYLGQAHITESCIEWMHLLVDELPIWFNARNSISNPWITVPGNVLFTVPKNTDIDRVACKEPDLNMFIQKGIGSYFRKRLRRVGINLNDQSINRSLAREGSVTDKLSTLDLSSASDSVSEGLVALLLPVTWFTLLDAVRCRVTIINGEEHRNQMFSSMGNGFTFELESMLFYVITEAVAHFLRAPGVISVYGDDIICPAEIAHDVEWVLGYMGFQVNPEKSCFSGPLRESCGGHYWNGLDITPFYIKEPITQLDQLIDVANKLRKWAEIHEGLGILNPEVEDIWLWLKSHVPDVLWGGGDTAFKYQLASIDVPAMRLSEETKSKDLVGMGGYLHWHNSAWERTLLRDAIETSTMSTNPTKRLRLRKVRVKAVPQHLQHFNHEV